MVSHFFSLPATEIYFSAFSAAVLSDGRLPSISYMRSFARDRFSCVRKRCFSDSSLRVLYFIMPAASSNMYLLPSGVEFRISDTLP